MKGTEVILEEMLFCRERRARLQEELIGKHHCPIISFCMNIPGPIKTNPEIRAAFEKGKSALLSHLKKEEIPVLDMKEFHENTGDELILAARCPADALKRITVSIEEGSLIGRLFDMDVIDTEGKKLSRPSYRTCIICGRQAQECARARRHSVREMQDKVEEILVTKS